MKKGNGLESRFIIYFQPETRNYFSERVAANARVEYLKKYFRSKRSKRAG